MSTTSNRRDRRGGPAAVDAPRGRRERQRLATRERIYATAIAEFERVGVAAAQIDRIAAEAGVARGTFYFHFRTREHVLLELQRRAQREVVAALAALGPPPDCVRAYCRRIFDVMMRSGTAHPSLRRELLALYVRGRVELELASEPLVVHLVDYFAEAAERGAVRRDIPPERLATHYLGSLFLSYLGDDGDTDDEFVDAAIDIFVRGVAP